MTISKITSLSLFFPAWNEEANIAKTINNALLVMDKMNIPYELIIVNDGSSDKTGQIAEDLAQTNNKVKVVSHERNLGYGAAVWSGIQASQYEFIFFTDADLQFDINEINELIKYIPEYQVILGYRLKRQDSFIRIFNAKAWNILNRLSFGLNVKDIDCAFKLIKADLLKELETKSRGAMLSAEILIKLQDQGYKFKEVAVTHLPRRTGNPSGAKLSVIFRAFREFFRTYKRLRTFK